MTSTPTVAIVNNDDRYLYRFRGSLLRALKTRGWKVLAVAPAGRAVPAIEQEDVSFVHWPLSRRSVNPLLEVWSLFKLWRIYRRTRPHLVHHFTPKVNIYGALAARMAGVPVVVATITGLGYVFTADGARARLIRPIVSVLYRIAFRKSDAVVFQNQDDISEVHAAGLLELTKAHYVPGGSGVDTAAFDPDAVDAATKQRLRGSLGLPDKGLVVLMVARMLWHKGIGEFVDCASIVKQHRNDAKFLLVGPEDPGNPAAIPSERLRQWHQEGSVRYIGEREDIRDLLALCDVLVLPSYREGLPRILIEGAAMGKPIVTTDVPGCRDVVDHDINGLLVPPRDPAALAHGVEQLLLSPGLRQRFSDATRERALMEFDERRTVARVLELYDTLLEQRGLGRLTACA